jgi:hypothetical protein
MSKKEPPIVTAAGPAYPRLKLVEQNRTEKTAAPETDKLGV